MTSAKALRRSPGILASLALALLFACAIGRVASARTEDPPPTEAVVALAPDSSSTPPAHSAAADPVVAARDDEHGAALPTLPPPVETNRHEALVDKISKPVPAPAKPSTVVAETPPRNALGNLSPSDERARVQRGLNRTDSVLRTVHAKVRRSFNKKASEDFERAMGLQKDALEALGENLFARADRLTQEARALARQIAVHLGPPQDDPDYVAIALERTDDAIGRAKEVLRDAGGPLERRRLTTLEKKQADARRLYKENATRKSYAATRDARDGVLTLLRDCDNLPVRAETAERALKRADRAMDMAKNELGERPASTASRLARSAREQMSKARLAFAKRNYRDTLIYSKLAERDLERAVNAQREITSRSE